MALRNEREILEISACQICQRVGRSYLEDKIHLRRKNEADVSKSSQGRLGKIQTRNEGHSPNPLLKDHCEERGSCHLRAETSLLHAYLDATGIKVRKLQRKEQST